MGHRRRLSRALIPIAIAITALTAVIPSTPAFATEPVPVDPAPSTPRRGRRRSSRHPRRRRRPTTTAVVATAPAAGGPAQHGSSPSPAASSATAMCTAPPDPAGSTARASSCSLLPPQPQPARRPARRPVGRLVLCRVPPASPGQPPPWPPGRLRHLGPRPPHRDLPRPRPGDQRPDPPRRQRPRPARRDAAVHRLPAHPPLGAPPVAVHATSPHMEERHPRGWRSFALGVD